MDVMKIVEKHLKKIFTERWLDNNAFFEWNDDDDFEPKIIIAGKEIILDKLKYNL
jgi:hypothetical protein